VGYTVIFIQVYRMTHHFICVIYGTHYLALHSATMYLCLDLIQLVVFHGLECFLKRNILRIFFSSESDFNYAYLFLLSRNRYEYMIKEGFVVLKGYNIVGDGTPQVIYIFFHFFFHFNYFFLFSISIEFIAYINRKD